MENEPTQAQRQVYFMELMGLLTNEQDPNSVEFLDKLKELAETYLIQNEQQPS